MVCEVTKERSPLLPLRHPQLDFFVCDIFDAAPKGDTASMEHPIFSLSTKPDMRVRRYEHNGSFIEIRPSHMGLATVHDRDVLIYCISQIMAAINASQQISQTVRFKAFDLLVATNRDTKGGGRSYELLKAAFERLQGTQISTNIITGGKETFDIFSLIDRARIVRETRAGRMQDVEIKLSDWVFNAIQGREVLTLHRDYFRLRKPLERRLYELARKHCGKQSEWQIKLETLQKKCGSASTLKEFRRLVGKIVEEDAAYGHIPDYTFTLENDMLTVLPKPEFRSLNAPSNQRTFVGVIGLKADTYEQAKAQAPGWDIYTLEDQWRDWMAGKETPRNPDAAFIAFCRKKGPYASVS